MLEVHKRAEKSKSIEGLLGSDNAPSYSEPKKTTLKDYFFAYLALTKPRIIELLIVSAIPAMLLAQKQEGKLDVPIIFWTIFGGWLGAASANCLNMVVDADIDQKMNRTKNRPIANKTITRTEALIFGIILCLASVTILIAFTHLLAAICVLVTILFYVFVYTMWLKRRTWQNVIWGGMAGCMPALVGWAGATGKISWEPVVLFMVVFFWTPPHTWALGMHYREDYRAAGVPMLPVLKDDKYVTTQMLFYTVATVITSFFLIPVTGKIYAITSIVVGIWFIVAMVILFLRTRSGKTVSPYKIFHQSNAYLAILSLGLAIDCFFFLLK